MVQSHKLQVIPDPKFLRLIEETKKNDIIINNFIHTIYVVFHCELNWDEWIENRGEMSFVFLYMQLVAGGKIVRQREGGRSFNSKKWTVGVCKLLGKERIG